MRRSVHQAGDRTPVFTLNGVTFGIIICNDSNFPELARDMAAQGATLLFVPSNNALPPAKADVVSAAREVDSALASANRMMVVRSDVAGNCGGFVSYGSSGIVDPRGRTLRLGSSLEPGLLVAGE
jgi:predicted amidohydrolase